MIQIRLLITMLIWALPFLVACGKQTSNSSSTDVMAMGAVNTGVVDPLSKATAKAQTVESLEDPLAYKYTVDSRAAFAIIDSLSPRCTACHRILTKGNSNGPGPTLNGLKDRAGQRVLGLSSYEYVRQSILDPGAYIVDVCPKGACPNVMYKRYQDKLNRDDIETVINFLLSLEAER